MFYSQMLFAYMVTPTRTQGLELIRIQDMQRLVKR